MARDLDQEARNKALVLEAFDALFNRRDFGAAEKYFSPTYIQHSAGIAQGREGLFSLVRGLTRRYESAVVVAEGDYVMAHGATKAVGGRPGSSSISSASREDVSQSIGTSSKTRRRRPNQGAASPCSARRFRNEHEPSFYRTVLNSAPPAPTAPASLFTAEGPMSSDTNIVQGHCTPLGRCVRSVFVGLVALAPPLGGQAKQGPFYHVNYYQVRSGDIG